MRKNYPFYLTNSIFKGKIALDYSLTATCMLLSNYLSNVCHITYQRRAPHQIVVRYSSFSFLLFSSGNFRFMGRLTHNHACDTLDSIITVLNTRIINHPIAVSHTLTFNLGYTLNLSNVANHITDCTYEPELFPALSINAYKPTHINIFSTGKVVVLGKQALDLQQEIKDYLHCNLLFL